MRVLMLSWEYPPRVIGGVAPHVRDLARALVARGRHVTVIAGDHPTAPEIARDRGVEVRRVRSPYPVPPDFPAEVLQFNLAAVEHGLALAREGRTFDVIHCHDWLVGSAGRALKQALRRPLVATIHATEFGRNRGLHNPLQHYISGMEWWLGYEARRVITCSRYMREEVQRVFQLPPEKIDVVPNGVDRQEFHLPPPLRHKAALLKNRMQAADQAMVFFMGRLVWEKGAQDLIDAMAHVRAKAPGARLVVAGDGPLRHELQQRAQSRGLGDAVYFPGFISGARRRMLLALADVAVFPSHYEPFGIVALEAMACGVPVVVGGVGGLAEVVQHGRNGLKVPPGEPVALAQAVLRVLAGQGLARRLVEQALEDVASRYSWDGIAARTEEVYRRVVEEGQLEDGQPARVAAGAGRRIAPVPLPSPKALPSPVPLRMAARANGAGRYYPTGEGSGSADLETLPVR